MNDTAPAPPRLPSPAELAPEPPGPRALVAGTVGWGARPKSPVIEIVVPVYNEERQLAASVGRLRGYLDSCFPFPAIITIADNASTDRTWAVAAALTAPGGRPDPRVCALHLDLKGRGRALKAAWLASTADVVAYMDVDLSTDLNALLPLVAPLVSGHSDLAIGTRLAVGSRVVRGPKREFISRSYNRLLHLVLRTKTSDAQCGFKAMRGDVARRLLPSVEDGAWFFDTELLTLAERAGLRIHEVPVDWVDDPDSRVDLLATSVADLKGVWRLRRRLGLVRHRLVQSPQPQERPLGSVDRAGPPRPGHYDLASTAMFDHPVRSALDPTLDPSLGA